MFQGINDLFYQAVDAVLGDTAKSKGYGKELESLILANFPDYPLGEIIYKAVRYKAKGNPEDLVKAAAWAKLLWDRRMKTDGKSEKGAYSDKRRDSVAHRQ